MVHQQIRSSCAHCGEKCHSNRYAKGELLFCCEGCKSVYELLRDNQLCTYYSLNSTPGATQTEVWRSDKYAFLDDPAIAKELIRFADSEQYHVVFHLPQIHCSSCLWLLEHLHKINSGIVSSRVDFIQKEVLIIFNHHQISLREVVEVLAHVGYPPALHFKDTSHHTTVVNRKTRLYKIGIAGFCFANIMMLSFPEYFSAGEEIEPVIRHTLTAAIVMLSIPVIFYSASEFFTNAWSGLQSRFLNIDAPIALALVITFGRSMYEIFSGTGTGYLDSMSGIVFFMLVGRWLQDRTYSAISFDRDFRSFFPISMDVVKANKVHPTQIENILPGDLLRIHHGELIPVDAILREGEASIDYSFVTGESTPVSVAIGGSIYAGGKQLGGLLHIEVKHEVAQSYLVSLWNKSGEGDRRVSKVAFTDVLSRYFTYIIFAIAAVAGTYWWYQQQPHLMWNALTTILIVACPCALLLAASFARGNMLRILSLHQCYVKNAAVIDKLASVDTVLFDKTGTLTQQNQCHVTYEGITLSDEQKTHIAGLLIQTQHPLSKSVLEYLQPGSIEQPESFQVIEGKGIEGWVDNHHYKIGSPSYVGAENQKSPHSVVVVKCDTDVIGTFYVGNVYREGVPMLLRTLSSQYPVHIISGDHEAEANYLHPLVGPKGQLRFHQSPHDKLIFVRKIQEDQHRQVLMVGDGLNDAGALIESHVGVAVTDNTNYFTPAADVIMPASKITSIPKILLLAQKLKLIIHLSFAVSILYNLIGLWYAVQGTLSPVIAAILMPCSSVTIVAITFGMTEYLARKYKLN